MRRISVETGGVTLWVWSAIGRTEVAMLRPAAIAKRDGLPAGSSERRELSDALLLCQQTFGE